MKLQQLLSRKSKNKLLLYCILLFLLALSLFAPANLSAQTKGQPKKFRLIFVQGDSYSDFQRVFKGFILELKHQNLITHGNVPIPQDSESVEKMWAWVNQHANSSKIEFLEDGFYSADYDEQKMQKIIKEIQQRINTRHDVDAIISYGTFAGKHLVKLDTSIPIIFASITDPIAANIVPSTSDSGKDNHVAIIIPNIDKFCISIFHNIFKFKKMGIAYDDTPNGRASIALSEIEKITKELNLELVRCTENFTTSDLELASNRLADCHKKLVKDGAEAIFLTTNISITAKYAQKIFAPILKARLPCFSRLGSSDVKLGALMSISETITLKEGAYSAELLRQIMEGARPRSLRQLYIPYIDITINTQTAARIGWQPSLETLIMVDNVFPQF